MGSAKVRRQVWQLGQVIPRLLVAVCVLDLALRFMPIDPLTFRGWEALLRYRAPGASFEPNRRYSNARSYGDLAAFGNLPGLRQYRSEIFTTDALGFRNLPHVRDEEISAILAGDSFVVGSGVSDDETLSSRLSERGGCVVYNAGTDQGAVVPDEIVTVAQRLHMRGNLVIRVYTESSEVPAVPTRRKKLLKELVTKLVERTPAAARSLVGRLRGYFTVSPLQILSGRALKALADDRILPNRYAGYVTRATLYNGDPMLFRASAVDTFYRRREVATDYWLWLRDELQKAHLDLWVVIVPSKYRVYRPFLVDHRPAEPGPGTYLDRLERALRVAGIPVLNLTTFLSDEAARHLKRGEYLYWLDDIHWNARGIALTAAAIRVQWPLTEASCRASHPLAVRKPQHQTRFREHLGHGSS
jgi:hypothetical protein